VTFAALGCSAVHCERSSSALLDIVGAEHGVMSTINKEY
jgi:hypothetical protein